MDKMLKGSATLVLLLLALLAISSAPTASGALLRLRQWRGRNDQATEAAGGGGDAGGERGGAYTATDPAAGAKALDDAGAEAGEGDEAASSPIPDDLAATMPEANHDPEQETVEVKSPSEIAGERAGRPSPGMPDSLKGQDWFWKKLATVTEEENPSLKENDPFPPQHKVE